MRGAILLEFVKLVFAGLSPGLRLHSTVQMTIFTNYKQISSYQRYKQIPHENHKQIPHESYKQIQ